MTERYPYVSTSERRRRMDEIFFNGKESNKNWYRDIIENPDSHLNRLAEANRTMQGIAFQGHLDDMKRLKNQKHFVAAIGSHVGRVTMTTPRQSFRNWVEELPRWIPHALRASALITAILYGVAL